MRFGYIFLLIFLLIGNAFATTCPSGFTDVTADYPDTFYAKDSNTCPTGYEPYTAPSTLDFSFNGLVMDTSPTLCGSGYHYENGECVAFVTGNCPSSFNRNATNDTTFYAKDNGICPAEYVNYTYGDNLHFIFNGLILSSAPTVCATGHYIDGTCGAYSSTGCITGYVDAGTDGVISAVDANGSCQSNYDFLGSYQSCTAETTDNLCTTLCNGDMSHTAAGQCAAACTAGFSKLKTDTGLSFTAWGTRTTHPSIVVETDDGRCYVNLAPGRATNAVNVQYNNTVYHTTE